MHKEEVKIPTESLNGSLCIPTGTKAIIVLVHGSGSNQYSIRNRYLSEKLNQKGFATLLINLLTDNENQIDSVSKHLRFDIDLLSKRLISITKWLSDYKITRELQIGYLSSSTGTAAALNSLACLDNIGAIVSRGGRVDLCNSDILKKLKTPLLVVVGSKDEYVINSSRRVIKDLARPDMVDLSIIPGASHFFEEEGKMDIVSKLSISWFQFHLLKNGCKFVNEYKGNWFDSLGKFQTRLQIKFRDRIAAGHILANMLSEYRDVKNVLIVGIPRGGIIIADIIAEKLPHADFGIAISKRLRHPNNSESSIGTILYDDSVYINNTISEISQNYIQMEISNQKKNLIDQITFYGLQDYDINYSNKTVILVDDGAHTGSTLIATSRLINTQNPKELVVVLPVLPKHIVPFLQKESLRVYYVRSPNNFKSVEEYYRDFRQVDDSTILEILQKRLTIYKKEPDKQSRQ
jgi:putative phosphoribosyl transferase